MSDLRPKAPKTTKQRSRPTRQTKEQVAAATVERRARFVDAYLLDPNATKAAKAAGFSSRTAHSMGSRLLREVEVWKAIAVKREERARRVQIDQDRVIQELAAVGFADMADYLVLGPNGSVSFDWSKIPPAASRGILELVVDEYVEGSGEQARPVRRTKLKLHPKIPALELLGRHLGMFVQKHKHEHEGGGGGPILTAAVTEAERREAVMKILSSAAARAG